MVPLTSIHVGTVVYIVSELSPLSKITKSTQPFPCFKGKPSTGSGVKYYTPCAMAWIIMTGLKAHIQKPWLVYKNGASQPIACIAGIDS